MELKSETIEFRDGTKLTVTEANWPADVKVSEMEREAENNPRKDNQRQFYAMAVYPKLAACSTGDIPTEEQAFLMPSAEHDKWYNAAARVNPNWFDPLEKAAKQLSTEAMKKKEKKRTKSTKG